MEWLSKLMHDLSALGFTPLMVVFMTMAVLLLRFPKLLSIVFPKIDRTGHNDRRFSNPSNQQYREIIETAKNARAADKNELEKIYLVDQQHCHEAMTAVTTAINSVRVEFHDGLSDMNKRIDGIFSILLEKK